MRILVQRARHATVQVDSKIVGKIDFGLLILVGIESDDTAEDAEWICTKLENLRIFNDENDKMNLSVKDVSGELLVVSQFTLHASTKKGNRPSYLKAAKPNIAIPIYEEFIHILEQKGFKVESGQFGADMDVTLTNVGPVTIWIDTKNRE